MASSSSSSSSSSSNANTNNHAVIVSSSRYWFNYRHVINALSFYQLCKQQGIPDENIVLMLADDIPSNARNPYKNGMYANGVNPDQTLYDDSIEIDYRGEDVTVENLVRVLLGRQGEPMAIHQGGNPYDNYGSQRRKQLNTDENSNILIYLTGHGGDQFFKFQDIEEITTEEIARTLDEMHRRKRYKEVLLVADTCQAFTLGDEIKAPNVMVIGSSLRGESSYAHHSDTKLGLSVIERYTHSFMHFLQKKGGLDGEAGNLNLREAMVDPYPYYSQRANVGFRTDLMERDINTTRLTDFFRNNQRTDSSKKEWKLIPKNPNAKLMGWPLMPSSQREKKAREYYESFMAEQRLQQQSVKEPGWEELLDGALPVYNPTNAPMIAMVLLLIGLVTLTSRGKR